MSKESKGSGKGENAGRSIRESVNKHSKRGNTPKKPKK